MRRTIWAVAISSMAAILVGAMAFAAPAEPGEPLFFAVEVEDQGRVVARPMLLGESGRRLTLRMVDPRNPELTRLGLELDPQPEGEAWKVGVRLDLPQLRKPAIGSLDLGHAEERRLTLQSDSGISVKLLLMRVESPEFEAFVQLARRDRGIPTS